MATYWMDKDNGDDGTGDGSEGNPYQTFAHTHNQISAGDTIVAKTASTDYELTNKGQDGTGYTLRGEETPSYNATSQEWEGAVFDGNKSGGDAFTWWLTDSTPYTFQDIVMKNIDTDYGLMWRIGADLTLTRCVFSDISLDGNQANDGISTNSTPSGTTITIEACVFSNWSMSARDGIINFDNGVTIELNVTNCSFYYSTGDYFMYCQNDTADSSVNFTNNIFYNSGSGGSLINGNSFTPTFNNNCIQGHSGYPSGSNNIEQDPKYIDPVNDDLRLQTDSPCMEVGGTA